MQNQNFICDKRAAMAQTDFRSYEQTSEKANQPIWGSRGCIKLILFSNH